MSIVNKGSLRLTNVQQTEQTTDGRTDGPAGLFRRKRGTNRRRPLISRPRVVAVEKTIGSQLDHGAISG